MNNVLVLGHTGYLGSYLKDNLVCDILKLENISRDYQFIINCIGKPNLEYCEENLEESWNANTYPIIFLKNKFPKSIIISFSSYYVYDDIGLCTENSKVTNLYNYTKHKLFAEQINSNGYTFRLGKLFGGNIEKQNKLTEYIIKQKNMTLDSVRFNPTSLKQVLRVITKILTTSTLYDFGIYNLSNTEIVSHFEYGKFISDFIPGKNITKLDKIQKCFHNYGRFEMSIDKLLTTFGNDLSISWKYDMVEYLKGIGYGT